MSHTLDLLAEQPHGTVAGYRDGCHTTAGCPGAVTCLDVHTRYVGDYSFSRRVDAGEDPAAIIAEEAETRALSTARDNAANRAARKTAAKHHRENENRKRRHQGKPAHRRPTIAETHGAAILELSSEGITDQGIADRLGLRLSTVGAVRRSLGGAKPVQVKKPRPEPTHRRIAARVRELHADGLTDMQIADALGSTRHSIGMIRRRLGLPLTPARTSS